MMWCQQSQILKGRCHTKRSAHPSFGMTPTQAIGDLFAWRSSILTDRWTEIIVAQVSCWMMTCLVWLRRLHLIRVMLKPAIRSKFSRSRPSIFHLVYSLKMLLYEKKCGRHLAHTFSAGFSVTWLISPTFDVSFSWQEFFHLYSLESTVY